MKKALYSTLAVVFAALSAGLITIRFYSPLNVLDSTDSILSSSEIQSLSNGLVDKLNDPSGAQFRKLARSSQLGIICGEINAKNQSGGYVGFVPFAAGVALPRALIVIHRREVVDNFPDDVRRIQSKLGCPYN